MTRSEVTRDALFGGPLPFAQPRAGYRVNVDSVLLVAFAARGRAPRLALDLGAGVGALTLMLARVGVAKRAVLIERETDLAALARENLATNAVARSGIERDPARAGLPPALPQRADLVLCNPPFYPVSAG